jgi:signal peptidase I
MDDPRPPAFPPPPTAASAEEALKPPVVATEPPVSPGKGVKETIESILIAFVLAFVFRAFVVEAFVIPTGSMATTLLGAHMRFTCRECGYAFDVNYAPRSSGGQEMEIPAGIGPEVVTETYTDPETGKTEKREKLEDRFADVNCPNCRHKLPPEDTKNKAVRHGDRILVLKYLYIPGVVSDPQRWDVVVFKTPDTQDPKDPPYTINYIKRLVGLPNEQLMILYGDLYTRPRDAGPEAEWKIRAKPFYAQEALWRVIYDHDYRPVENGRTDGWSLPWRQETGSGWDTGDRDKSRAFTFDNMAGEGRLRFAHDKPPRQAGGGPKPPDYFSDWLAYDVTMPSSNSGAFTVNDLRLCFSYERKAGDGPLRARLTKLKREFVLEMLPDRIRLLHREPGKVEAEEVGAVKPVDPSAMTGPIRVEFANVDCQVSVRVNEHLVFQKAYDPGVKDLLARVDHDDRSLPPPSVSIEAARQRSTLSHVSLWRDVYYTPTDPSRPIHTTTLGPDEYFVLGDNSAASSDARFWRRPVDLSRDEDLTVEAGRVPGRWLLGRAFFVYWPAGHRPFLRAPAVIPDFGGMRLIH